MRTAWTSRGRSVRNRCLTDAVRFKKATQGACRCQPICLLRLAHWRAPRNSPSVCELGRVWSGGALSPGADRDEVIGLDGDFTLRHGIRRDGVLHLRRRPVAPDVGDRELDRADRILDGRREFRVIGHESLGWLSADMFSTGPLTKVSPGEDFHDLAERRAQRISSQTPPFSARDQNRNWPQSCKVDR